MPPGAWDALKQRDLAQLLPHSWRLPSNTGAAHSAPVAAVAQRQRQHTAIAVLAVIRGLTLGLLAANDQARVDVAFEEFVNVVERLAEGWS